MYEADFMRKPKLRWEDEIRKNAETKPIKNQKLDAYERTCLLERNIEQAKAQFAQREGCGDANGGEGNGKIKKPFQLYS